MTSRRLAIAALAAAAVGAAAGPACADPYEDLFDAIRRDDADAVRDLMLKGVGTNSPDPKLGPAIVFAAKTRSFKAVDALLESPLTEVDVPNAAGETALMYAALYGRLDLAKRLVARGAQVNRTGWTPLHYAASGGSLDMVRWLIEKNAYLDAGSANHTTPLMIAARQGNPDVARLLVEEGADPTLRNDAGLTAADYFERTGATDMAAWLRGKATEFAAKYGTEAQPAPPAKR